MTEIGEIQERTNIEEWRWVPTEWNVADEATRSKVSGKIISDEWFSGPRFLLGSEEFWPTEKNSTYPPETGVELKEKKIGTRLIIRKYD